MGFNVFDFIDDTLGENDPNSTENVAKAYRQVNEKLSRSEGSKDEDWWKESFSKLGNKGAKNRPEQKPLDRWKSQIDAMIKSGNQTLQQKGFQELSSYHSRMAERPPQPAQDPTSIREYQYAVGRGEFDGSYPEWLQERKARGTTINTGDQYTKSSDYIVDSTTGMPVDVPVHAKKENLPPEWVYGHEPTAEEAGKLAATQAAMDNLLRLRDNLAENGNDVTGIEGWMAAARSGKALPAVLLNAAMNLVGKKMSPGEAQSLSMSMMISNQITYAFRGAQVSAAEQDKMDRQLPIPGQPEGLYMANMANSYKTLVNQLTKNAKARGLQPPDAVDNFMEFQHPDSGTKYRIMPDGSIQRWED